MQKSTSTPQARALYYALLKQRIRCKLEPWDGYKHVDISIPWAKLYIEIDGFQHYFNARQIEADLKRSYYSITKDGFETIRIPNPAITADVTGVAHAIAGAARKRYYAMLDKNRQVDYDDNNNKDLSIYHLLAFTIILIACYYLLRYAK